MLVLVVAVVEDLVVLVLAAPLLPEPDGVSVSLAVLESDPDDSGALVVTGAAVVVTPEASVVTVPGAELAVVVTAGVCVAAGRPRVFGSIKRGEYVAVPEYAAQPGTVVLGGARPPPQSRNSHSSPLPGTYQIRVAYA